MMQLNFLHRDAEIDFGLASISLCDFLTA